MEGQTRPVGRGALARQHAWAPCVGLVFSCAVLAVHVTVCFQACTGVCMCVFRCIDACSHMCVFSACEHPTQRLTHENIMNSPPLSSRTMKTPALKLRRDAARGRACARATLAPAHGCRRAETPPGSRKKAPGRGGRGKLIGREVDPRMLLQEIDSWPLPVTSKMYTLAGDGKQN